MKSDGIKHIAFIMDGNGRWASKRLLPRNTGHREGVNVMKRIIKACFSRGIPYVSFYAFSTENTRRPESEVRGLRQIMEKEFPSLKDEFIKNNLKLNVMGDISYFGSAQNAIKDAVRSTSSATGGVVNIALNYGGRDELERAARLLKEGGNARLSDFLYTANQPDPDILIRTGGEKRLSNFMLYQLAYTELFFSDTYWPDFSEEELNSIIDEYYKRDRRFGK